VGGFSVEHATRVIILTEQDDHLVLQVNCILLKSRQMGLTVEVTHRGQQAGQMPAASIKFETN
jgi:hypothetical protein